MIGEIEQAVTVAVKECLTCGFELIESDRYCRRCGISQSRRMDQPRATAYETIRFAALGGDYLSSLDVTSSPVGSNSYHTVTGPLVESVTASLLLSTTTQLRSPLAKLVIVALIWLLIWLIIVLLSPFDAYAAAKAAVGGDNQ